MNSGYQKTNSPLKMKRIDFGISHEDNYSKREYPTKTNNINSRIHTGNIDLLSRAGTAHGSTRVLSFKFKNIQTRNEINSRCGSGGYIERSNYPRIVLSSVFVNLFSFNILSRSNRTMLRH